MQHHFVQAPSQMAQHCLATIDDWGQGLGFGLVWLPGGAVFAAIDSGIVELFSEFRSCDAQEAALRMCKAEKAFATGSCSGHKQAGLIQRQRRGSTHGRASDMHLRPSSKFVLPRVQGGEVL